MKNKIKEEISLEIKQKSCMKLKFKKLTDSLKHIMTEMKKNEKNLFIIEELLIQSFDSCFQFTFSFLINCIKIDVKALKTYEKKKNK